ncbi:uncharacterized protein METZ01_LOCUS223329, partial [marine metagenome]
MAVMLVALSLGTLSCGGGDTVNDGDTLIFAIHNEPDRLDPP